MSDDGDDLDEWMIGPPDGKKPKPKGERRKKVRKSEKSDSIGDASRQAGSE